jgi:uncharacterized protein
MRTKLLEKQIMYTGRELSSHWAYKNADLKGDSLVAFIGPCDVETGCMVDLADNLAGECIKSARMVHFIMELFGRDMEKSVLYQRVLILVIKDVVRALRGPGGPSIKREGDDLYVDDGHEKRKLSVSIATVGPVSALVHAGVNVDPAGAPVAAAGLAKLGIDEITFATAVLEAVEAEINGIDEARVKTLAVD